MDNTYLYEQLVRIEKRFQLCCHQLNLIDGKLDALQVRYVRLKRTKNRNARFFLRLQIATMEGMRNVLYQYAKLRGHQIAEIRRGLFDENVDVHDYVEIPEWEEF